MALWDRSVEYGGDPNSAHEVQPMDMGSPFQQQFQQPQFQQQYQQQSYSPAIDQVMEQVVERENKPISPAVLRLEQGKLYQMLLDHDLFSQVDAHPHAVENVQEEIKAFITQRLEVLLGIRPEGEFQGVQVKSPFDEKEVDVLKALAKKLLGGLDKQIETKKTGEFTPVKTQVQQAPKPVTAIQSVPKQKIVKKAVPQQPKPVSNKPINQMTQEEIVEANKKIDRKKAVPSDSTKQIPQPTFEQRLMKEQMAAQNASIIRDETGLAATTNLAQILANQHLGKI